MMVRHLAEPNGREVVEDGLDDFEHAIAAPLEGLGEYDETRGFEAPAGDGESSVRVGKKHEAGGEVDGVIASCLDVVDRLMLDSDVAF